MDSSNKKEDVAWPPEISEEEKAKALVATATETKKRFGDLRERKKLPPQVSEKQLVDRKLREGRAFFDSADYFRALQGVRDAPPVTALPSCIFFFKRDDATGALVRNQVEPFSETLMQQLVAPQKTAYFDSADWSLSLHGLLEYPKNTPAHPILAHFSKDNVAIVAHPMHEQALSQEQLHAIAQCADEELRKKYGHVPMPTTTGVLKLKLRGHTPHDGKVVLFDSADWSLTLKNTVLPPPNFVKK